MTDLFKVLLVAPISEGFQGRNHVFSLPFLSLPTLAAYMPEGTDIEIVHEKHGTAVEVAFKLVYESLPKHLQKAASMVTWRRHMKPYMYWKSCRSRPELSEEDKIARVEFCKRTLKWIKTHRSGHIVTNPLTGPF